MTMSATAEGVDMRALQRHLEAERPGLLQGDLGVELIQGGRSNLTYRITDGRRSWALRRPPLGHVVETAHDMGREARVMSALTGTEVPVPTIAHICDDDSVIGAPFYLMQWVEGTVYRDVAATRHLGAARARALSLQLVDILAALHRIVPSEVGLEDFGRSAGFMQRQVRRFSQQLHALGERNTELLDELADRLATDVPANPEPCIVHGDYRLDNVMVAEDHIVAVVDWELSTLGDPLADLGLLLCYWTGVPGPLHHVIAKGIDTELGFPPPERIVERYEGAMGRSVGPLSWYVAFGYFKMAVIREGIHHRHRLGGTVGEGFETVGELVGPLAEQGLQTLEGN